MHKPSILWPPPGEDESKEIRQGIRHLLRSVTGLNEQDRFRSFLRRGQRQKYEHVSADRVVEAGRLMDLGASTSAPSVVDGQCQRIVLEIGGREPLVVESQIQFYAPNNLLSHPLVSPCRAYLGGLPPLFFIAGDKEVLRDEVIYTSVFSLHCFVSLLTSDLEPTEQRTRPSTRFRTNPNDCTPRSRSSRRNTPLRLRSTFKFMMVARTSCPSCSRLPLLRSSVSGRLRTFVVL